MDNIIAGDAKGSDKKKIKQGKGRENDGRSSVLGGMVSDDFSEKVAHEQTPK